MSNIISNIAIIGGGAAGFFAAMRVKEVYPNSQVTIYEKSDKILSKVKVSGGGRCNVCNAVSQPDELCKNYPRGEKQLRKAFGFFSCNDTIAWFKQRGVELVVQEDNCVFPKSQNSQTIIDCFLKVCLDKEIIIHTKHELTSLNKNDDGTFQLTFNHEKNICADKVIVTTGGYNKKEKFNWLAATGHKIIDPVPSLFTFNMPNEAIRQLMGLVVENAQATLPGTKLKSTGPLLITHWGMSGPAILKLSAFGARILAEKNYQFIVLINWAGNLKEDELRVALHKHFTQGQNKLIRNWRYSAIPQRLWEFLLDKINIPRDKNCAALGAKELNKLLAIITADAYQVSGKTTFKEEFVTCGGVDLSEVSFRTMQSKKLTGLYFAGEVLDIDGITGGFNFQAAWTTGYLAGSLQDE